MQEAFIQCLDFFWVVSETPACLSEMSQLLSESCIVSSLGGFCWYNEKRQFLLLLPLLCDRTIGTLYVTFFITVTASLTIPFRCETHPSGLRTLQAERNVENTIGDEGFAQKHRGIALWLLDTLKKFMYDMILDSADSPHQWLLMLVTEFMDQVVVRHFSLKLPLLQVFPQVFCDWQGEHLALVACFGVASILPIIFLAYCLWIMCQYPKRLHNGDSKFMRLGFKGLR